MSSLHLLRPWWLLCLLPLLILSCYCWRQRFRASAWEAVCDKHLLLTLLAWPGKTGQRRLLLLLFTSALCMIIALVGPSWSRLPVPTYKEIQPRVLILDMSATMLEQDILPDRLTRAKFKLHDLFERDNLGQLALIVYTGEPFIVSPLTDDAQTIDALLPVLTPEIMPVAGQNLASALDEAQQLINNAGFTHGQILVLTGEPPSNAAIHAARSLADKQIYTSILAVTAGQRLSPLFQALVAAGQGQLLNLSTNDTDLNSWLAYNMQTKYHLNKHDGIPMWRDEGRWFLLPAFILLLPIYRRGWLQRLQA